VTISVLVVDDSVVIRRLVTTVLDADPDIKVIATAANGRIALSKLAQIKPDLITLDIEMPDMDGLQTLRELRKLGSDIPVIMFSTLTERAAKTTLEALALGARDYVTKPANVGSVAAGMESVRTQLIPKIKGLYHAARRPAPSTVVPAARTAAPPVRISTAPPRTPQVLAIGCSTGGPEALAQLLKALPGTLPLPVVVVQHMPPVFTAMFAKRLDAQCALRVREAQDGDLLEPGLVLIAPGDFHMTLRRLGARTAVKLDQGPQENFCRPAVDPLFRSVASMFGTSALALVLTGMGEDGLRGAGNLRASGGRVLVQDAATSTIWGMPGAIAQAGLATQVLPLPQLAGAVLAAVTARPKALAGDRR
jgi:two-component system chemotaxis response regulator CheB